MALTGVRFTSEEDNCIRLGIGLRYIILMNVVFQIL